MSELANSTERVDERSDLQAVLAPIEEYLEEYRAVVAEFTEAEPVVVPWREELLGEKETPSVISRIDYELGHRFGPVFRKLLETVEAELAGETAQLSPETEQLIDSFGKVPEARRRYAILSDSTGYYWGGKFIPFEESVASPEFPIDAHLVAFYGALDRIAAEGSGSPAKGFARHFVEDLLSENRELLAELGRIKDSEIRR